MSILSCLLCIHLYPCSSSSSPTSTLSDDAGFRKYVDLYAKDKDAFFKDFAAAYARLMELGCKNLKAKL